MIHLLHCVNRIASDVQATLKRTDLDVPCRPRNGKEHIMNAYVPGMNQHRQQELRQRCESVCVVFGEHTMPPGADQPTGRIGIEYTHNQWLLHVDRRIAYAGDDPMVRNWFRSGTRAFADFDGLVGWLAQITGEGHAPDHVDDGDAHIEADGLTDLNGVDLSTVRTYVGADALERQMRLHVVGQDRGIRAIASAVARHVGKTNPRRPLSQLVLGPTGTGKTLTAQTLAAALTELSGRTWQFLRLDMNEYSESHTVARLHGAPPGYLGHGDGQDLAGVLARSGDAVVLFDEIEKAHPVVLQALMSLLDSGRLDATRANSGDARGCILLFTSNLGGVDLAEAVTTASSAEQDEIARRYLLGAGMLPEIVARFTSLVVYTPLGGADVARVAALSVARVAQDYGLRLNWVEPDYLSALLQRAHGNRGGVRGIEYLAEADLGPSMAQIPPGASVRVAASGTGAFEAVLDERPVEADDLLDESQSGTR